MLFIKKFTFLKHEVLKIYLKRNYSTNIYSTNSIRSSFISYFESKDHKYIQSSSLVPKNDDSILFTNAGMVQFKNYFLGLEIPLHKKIVTVQKCIRAGGKHNDLENVGKTARHHSFFEMLGNFSFGDYGKEQAISFAWDYLTKELMLPKEKFRITVHFQDNESYDIWNKKIGIPKEKIIYGDSDNFWSMGEIGPCGPCSEIFYYQEQPDTDGEHWLEIWNLVFMQFEKTKNKKLIPLKVPCVDTGMGLERLASIIQKKKNNFEIDSISSVINAAKILISKKTKNSLQLNNSDLEISLKIIVDHLRAAVFLIYDDVVPSNYHRGYVLRRILRRATRYGYSLGVQEPFLSELFPALLESIGDAYPSLQERKNLICDIIIQEELSFLKTIYQGMNLLNDCINKKELTPEIVFQLYDTYGFPLDLTKNIAEEKNYNINFDKVLQYMKEQKQRGKYSWRGSGEMVIPEGIKKWKLNNIFPKCTFYQKLKEDCIIKNVLIENSNVWVAIDPCPFYPRGGGQVGDIGYLLVSDHSKNYRIRVLDTIEPYKGGVVLLLENKNMNLIQKDAKVLALVNKYHRQEVSKHHTATHLLHASLRTILGENIVQSGSYVHKNFLRFDFNYSKKLTKKEILSIEDWINNIIYKNIKIQTYETPMKEIKKDENIISLFNEKYGEIVRVVKIDEFSKELCCGTHAFFTGDLGIFKIISENSIGSGCRRIQAIVGKSALQWLTHKSKILENVAEKLDITDYNQLTFSIEKLINEKKQLQKTLESLTKRISDLSLNENKIATVNYLDTLIHIYQFQEITIDMIKKIGRKLSENEPNAIHLIIFGQNISCYLGKKFEKNSSISACKIIQQIINNFNGKGGGNEIVAHAYFKDVINTNKILQWCNELSNKQ